VFIFTIISLRLSKPVVAPAKTAERNGGELRADGLQGKTGKLSFSAVSLLRKWILPN